jgi:transcriptional regulator with XRE-family HTH domain
MDKEIKEIADRIKYLRKDILKLKQHEFANALGLKQNNISNIERGENRLTKKNIDLISFIYNINPEWITNGSGDIFLDLNEEENFYTKVGALLFENNRFKKRVLIQLLSLNKEDWEKIEDLINKFSSEDNIFKLLSDVDKEDWLFLNNLIAKSSHKD